MDHSVELSADGPIATITMANPPRHTMTAPMVVELNRLIAEIESDAEVRVLVLTGGGEGVFVAHYEVAELADSSERVRAREAPTPARTDAPRLHGFHQLMRRLEQMPKVTVAAVNGHAQGGGCELALSCDFRLMADGPFRFGLPETGVGIIPGAGGTQRFARLLGVARALDLILHGTALSPADALELGLVSRVFAAESFRDEVGRFAARLATRAPIALAAAKRAIREGVDLPLDDALALEQQLFNTCMASEDAAGAMRAALAGKPYKFTGR